METLIIILAAAAFAAIGLILNVSTVALIAAAVSGLAGAIAGTYHARKS